VKKNYRLWRWAKDEESKMSGLGGEGEFLEWGDVKLRGKSSEDDDDDWEKRGKKFLEDAEKKARAIRLWREIEKEKERVRIEERAIERERRKKARLEEAIAKEQELAKKRELEEEKRLEALDIEQARVRQIRREESFAREQELAKIKWEEGRNEREKHEEEERKLEAKKRELDERSLDEVKLARMSDQYQFREIEAMKPKMVKILLDSIRVGFLGFDAAGVLKSPEYGPHGIHHVVCRGFARAMEMSTGRTYDPKSGFLRFDLETSKNQTKLGLIVANTYPKLDKTLLLRLDGTYECEIHRQGNPFVVKGMLEYSNSKLVRAAVEPYPGMPHTASYCVMGDETFVLARKRLYGLDFATTAGEPRLKKLFDHLISMVGGEEALQRVLYGETVAHTRGDLYMRTMPHPLLGVINPRYTLEFGRTAPRNPTIRLGFLQFTMVMANGEFYITGSGLVGFIRDNATRGNTMTGEVARIEDPADAEYIAVICATIEGRCTSTNACILHDLTKKFNEIEAKHSPGMMKMMSFPTSDVSVNIQATARAKLKKLKAMQAIKKRRAKAREIEDDSDD